MANSLQAGEQITGTFTVGPDGRGTMTISTGETWQFCLASTEHALLINFNTGVASGSGTIDQLFTTKTPLANGLRYVFQVSGLDQWFESGGDCGRLRQSREATRWLQTPTFWI